MARNKIGNLDNGLHSKALYFVSSYLWNIENLILEYQVQESVGEFEATNSEMSMKHS